MEKKIFKLEENNQTEKSFDENFLVNSKMLTLSDDQLKQIKGGGGDDEDDGIIKW